jgi:hypothetical protein
MKRLSFLMAMTLTGTLLLYSQEPGEEPAAGFLNIVNLTGLKTPTYIELGTFALNGGEAMKPGETSGVLAIKPGSYPFSISNAGAKPAKVTGDFTMEAGKTVAIICYDDLKIARDGSEEVKLRYTVLVESEETGPRLSLVSLLRTPTVALEVSGRTVNLTPRLAHLEKVAMEDEIRIEYEGRTVAEFKIEKSAHYLGFLFENVESGEVELSLIENEKLEYQPPLETEDEEE